MKTRIFAASAVKGLRVNIIDYILSCLAFLYIFKQISSDINATDVNFWLIAYFKCRYQLQNNAYLCQLN